MLAFLTENFSTSAAERHSRNAIAQIVPISTGVNNDFLAHAEHTAETLLQKRYAYNYAGLRKK